MGGRVRNQAAANLMVHFDRVWVIYQAMADDEDQSSKTEDPTEHKLRKLREEGNVPTSREVNNLFAVLGMVLVAGLAAPWAFGRLLELSAAVIQNAGVTDLDESPAVGMVLSHVGMSFFTALIPVLAVLMVLGYLGSALQNGLIFSTKPIGFNLQKISPLAGLKRMFSLKSVVELLKSVVKLVVIGSAMVMVVWQRRETLVALVDGDTTDLLHHLQLLMLWVLGAALAVMALLAVVDVLFQRFQYLQQNRMSRRELKDEMRDSEGDPHIRARQRQIRMERARKRMMAAVPKADVVVTNPTHYACALRYKPEEGDAAPVLVAKGVDAVAMRIREVAEENGVPLYEDPPLARQLWADVEIDEAVPVQLYEIIAKVIAFVMDLRRRAA
ncbi:MAG: flagellar biosynthesis protein FlhB [Proteobacteria bacterium]|nr:flagellar biosynthesis protein FlhB [Pseudomonadota bacterium]